jgi:hypothetical protein
LAAKTISAELSEAFRRDGLGEGIRVTEDGIKAAVLQSKKFQAAEAYRLGMATRESFLQDLKEGLRMTERALMRITVLLGYGVPVEEESHAVRAASARVRSQVTAERGAARVAAGRRTARGDE